MPRCTVEDEAVGRERAATLSDSRRRGLRQATRLWTGGVARGRSGRVTPDTATGLTPADLIRWEEPAGPLPEAGDGDPDPAGDGGLRWPEHRPDRVPCCPGISRSGARCRRRAGRNTDHEGVGRCSRHGGNRWRGRAEGAWLVGHGFGRQLDVTPWDALLLAVKIAAGKVAYIESVISQATSDRALEVGHEGGATGVTEEGELVEGRDWSFWLRQSEVWFDRLARSSKMAIDAGVAEALVEAVRGEAETVARILVAVVSDPELGLTEEQLQVARGRMRRELLALDAAERGEVLEGEVTSPSSPSNGGERT